MIWVVVASKDWLISIIYLGKFLKALFSITYILALIVLSKDLNLLFRINFSFQAIKVQCYNHSVPDFNRTWSYHLSCLNAIFLLEPIKIQNFIVIQNLQLIWNLQHPQNAFYFGFNLVGRFVEYSLGMVLQTILSVFQIH